MDSDKATEFDQLFDSFLTILSLKHHLKIEVKERENYSLDFFGASSSGRTDMIIIITSIFHWHVGYWQLQSFNFQISKNFKVDRFLSGNINPNFRFNELGDWYYFDSNNEQGMLDLVKELIMTF